MNNNINLEIDRDLEKIFNMTRTEQELIDVAEDGLSEADILTWVINTSNIPLRDRNGSIVRILVSNDVADGFRSIYWVIDNGNGTASIVNIQDYDLLDEITNTLNVNIDNHLSAPKYNVLYYNSGATSKFVGAGQALVIDTPATTTDVNLDLTYTGLAGQTFIIQNYKSSGTLTISIGAHSLLGAGSPIIAQGASAEFLIVTTNSGPTNYKISRIN